MGDVQRLVDRHRVALRRRLALAVALTLSLTLAVALALAVAEALAAEAVAIAVAEAAAVAEGRAVAGAVTRGGQSRGGSGRSRAGAVRRLARAAWGRVARTACGVDADHLTGGVGERSARVTRLDVGVGLDQAGQVLRVGAGLVGRGDRLVQAGYLAGGEARRTAHSSGVADADHLVADRDLGRVTGLGGLQAGGVLQLQYRNVVGRVVARHTGRVGLAVADVNDGDLRRAFHHVVVGQHLTVGGQHDPGPGGASALEAEHGVHVDQPGRDLRGHRGRVERLGELGAVRVRLLVDAPGNRSDDQCGGHTERRDQRRHPPPPPRRLVERHRPPLPAMRLPVRIPVRRLPVLPLRRVVRLTRLPVLRLPLLPVRRLTRLPVLLLTLLPVRCLRRMTLLSVRRLRGLTLLPLLPVRRLRGLPVLRVSLRLVVRRTVLRRPSLLGLRRRRRGVRTLSLLLPRTLPTGLVRRRSLFSVDVAHSHCLLSAFPC